MFSPQTVRDRLESPAVQRFIVGVIVINSITIGAETSVTVMDRFGGALHLIDRIALVIFIVELLARVYGYRRAFLKDPWNWFDTIIIGIALIPHSGPASVLRSLRILRALRLVSRVPSMRRVVSALLAAIPGMTSVIALLGLVVYVAAVMATNLFGKLVPEHFGGLPESLFSLFQIMTGEGWPDIAAATMEHHPLAWMFFVGYILLSSFVVLNLFMAVVVSAMDREPDPEMRAVLDELARLHAKVDALQKTPDEPGMTVGGGS
ncbi:MAG: ion transporter [Streptosporangiales bacterium]|nr:ion transporter [Streptosporangiales bacterium]